MNNPIMLPQNMLDYLAEHLNSFPNEAFDLLRETGITGRLTRAPAIREMLVAQMKAGRWDHKALDPLFRRTLPYRKLVEAFSCSALFELADDLTVLMGKAAFVAALLST